MQIILMVIRKFLVSSQDKKDISRLSFFSYFLVALAVAIPILVLSVTNGLQNVTKKNILNYEFHYQIHFPSLKEIDKLHNIKDAKFWFYYEDKCLISSRNKSTVTRIRAFNKSDYELFFFKTYKRVVGRRKPRPGGIVLAESLAADLGVSVGDKIKLIVLDHSIGFNQVSQKLFRVDGVVSLAFKYYDMTASFILKNDADKLFLLNKKSINRVGIFYKNRNKRESLKTKNELQKIYPKAFIQASFEKKVFQDAKEEKKTLALAMLAVIFVVFVAIFITLNVVLADKLRDIELLRVIGMSKSWLLKLFLSKGFFIAFIGSIIGFFLGTLLVLNLHNIISFFELLVNNFLLFIDLLGIKRISPGYVYALMDKNVYYQTSLPFQFLLKDFVIQGVGTFLCALIAALSPALKLLKTNPAEILRNE